jgi:type I restriction enzyme S subunit
MIVNVLEPYHGSVLDPACGSRGMFVQSAHFIERMKKNPTEQVMFYGMEKNPTTIRLARMNLAVHGLEGDIRKAITYYEDPHELLNKTDIVMANPPFNVDEIDANKVKNDPRLPFGLPGVNKKGAVSNGNYVWISFFYSYLNQEGRLGNFVTLKRGYDLPERERERGDVPIVSSSGITGYHNEAIVNGPGVVTGRYGSLGQVYYIKQDFWPLNTSLYVQDFKGNNPRFFSYLLTSLGLERKQTAGAVPGVNRNVLHEMKVKVPDLAEQEKIASKLSAYDDLIDNNRRRIQLLEQTARLLYKEWFVHLRFPGHEHVKIIDGMPEGWKVMNLGDKVTLNYGKGLRADDRVEGPYPVYGSSGIIGNHDKALVKGPGIIVGRKGNVGSVFWSSKDFYPIDTVYFIDAETSNYYLYHALQSMRFVSSDAAVPGLNRNFAYSRRYLLPSEKILLFFEETVDPIYNEIFTLEEYNNKLKQARDLLLPRLMSGEIAV